MSGIARFAVSLAAATRPRQVRERYREEWLADLGGAAENGVRPSGVAIGALLFSATLGRTAPAISGMEHTNNWDDKDGAKQYGRVIDADAIGPGLSRAPLVGPAAGRLGTIRSPTAADQAGTSSSDPSNETSTAAATSSSDAPTNSSNGAGSRCAQTRPPATTMPPPSNGSTPALATRPRGFEGACGHVGRDVAKSLKNWELTDHDRTFLHKPQSAVVRMTSLARSNAEGYVTFARSSYLRKENR